MKTIHGKEAGSCFLCEFSHPVITDPETVRCRRYPPVFINHFVAWQQPKVFAQGSCAEFIQSAFKSTEIGE